MQQDVFPSSPSLSTNERAEYLNQVIPVIETEPPQRTATPILTQEVKDYEYKNYIVDLTVAHTDLSLGLLQLGIVADSMTIIQADSSFSYKLNSISNDSTNATAGQKEDQFEISEIYITNTAATGNAVIRIVWNPRLMRVR